MASLLTKLAEIEAEKIYLHYVQLYVEYLKQLNGKYPGQSSIIRL